MRVSNEAGLDRDQAHGSEHRRHQRQVKFRASVRFGHASAPVEISATTTAIRVKAQP
jgi:hypothetical protein